MQFLPASNLIVSRVISHTDVATNSEQPNKVSSFLASTRTKHHSTGGHVACQWSPSSGYSIRHGHAGSRRTDHADLIMPFSTTVSVVLETHSYVVVLN